MTTHSTGSNGQVQVDSDSTPTFTAEFEKADCTNTIAGSSRESIAYSPYGYHHAGKITTLIAFNGQWLDPASKGYPLGKGYRILSTVLYRFHKPDSLSPFDSGGLNAYGYCLGDPVNHADPSGHVPHFLRSLGKGIRNLLGTRTRSNVREVRDQIAAFQARHNQSPVSSRGSAITLTPVASPRQSFSVFNDEAGARRDAALPSYDEIFNGELPSYESAIARGASRSPSLSSVSSEDPQSSATIDRMTPQQIQEAIRTAVERTRANHSTHHPNLPV
ncbi:RHS repeat-associated core domain-containing protein [Pantoea sp. Tr-811]|uniref:RHS repeat-associated core domain-containing protein n=1 Tax=Pantoea sp. Tr-811 TaxID=2608361 RepID=UPI001424305E|nr:RHS repeat-associated core domain-containing protein [Pantoea sp. Tr-811]NIF26272.1 RHS repeat-associated core domain-containing protein [Pantoea sp. Tr-811]